MLLLGIARRVVGSAMALASASLVGLMVAIAPAGAADPIRIGLSLSLTGPTSPAGKQVLAGLEIWRDDVNAKGGLLGRPVQLVYYDDQGSPANAPGIYAKLMGVDKVDLLIGPYSTNVIAATHAGDHPGQPHHHRHLRARRQQGVQVSALLLDELAGAVAGQLLEMRVRSRARADAEADHASP